MKSTILVQKVKAFGNREFLALTENSKQRRCYFEYFLSKELCMTVRLYNIFRILIAKTLTKPGLRSFYTILISKDVTKALPKFTTRLIFQLF